MLMTQWLARAVETVNASGEMARYFTRCGCLLRVDGSNDDAIRLEGHGTVDYMQLVPPLLQQDVVEAQQLVAAQDDAAQKLCKAYPTEAAMSKLTKKQLQEALLSIGLSIKGTRLAKNRRKYKPALWDELFARLVTLLGDDPQYVTERNATTAAILVDGPEPDDMKVHLEGTPSKPQSLDGERELEECVGGQAAAEFLEEDHPGQQFQDVDVDVDEDEDVDVDEDLNEATEGLAFAMQTLAHGRKIDGFVFDYYNEDHDQLAGRAILTLWDNPRGWFLGRVLRRERAGALKTGMKRLRVTNGHMTWRIAFAPDERWGESSVAQRTITMDLPDSRRGPGVVDSDYGQWVLLKNKASKNKQKTKKPKASKRKQKMRRPKKKKKKQRRGYA